MKYEKLFQPGKIGNLELRNRVVMTAMGALMGDWNGCTTPEQIRFYEDRAKGGCGLIIPEFTSVDADSGHCNPIQLGIYDSRQIKSFQLICEAVHRHGAKIFIQLHHGGREAPPACNGGRQAMAPSVELNSVVGRATILPREMTIEDIDNLVGKYVQAAVNSELAGADGVEVHAAHGYLVQQFLSPYTNKRTDEYGGSMENRCRFLVRILTGIRAAVSRDFVVGARINGNDFVEGGNDLAACTEIAKHLEPYVDYFNVSCGVYASAPTMIEPCYSPEGWRKDLAKTIKAAVHVPVIAVNTIKHPETAERFLQEGVSDFVGMSRMQLADPDVVKKAMAGREDLIRYCLSCMHCVYALPADVCGCTMNPRCRREAFTPRVEDTPQTGAGRKVVVVGAGPAGCLAAITLAQRGFRPILCDKNDFLGGMMVPAGMPIGKQEFQNGINYYANMLRELKVDVRLNTEVTPELLQAEAPYAVIAAVGSYEFIPPIPGADGENVIGARRYILERPEIRGKKVVVLGCGQTGLEAAHMLAALGNDVTEIEMQERAFITLLEHKLDLEYAEASGVKTVFGHKVLELTDSAVVAQSVETGEQVTFAADVIIPAIGVRSNSAEVEKLRACGVEKFFNIGDSAKTGMIYEAISAAYDCAIALE